MHRHHSFPVQGHLFLCAISSVRIFHGKLYSGVRTSDAFVARARLRNSLASWAKVTGKIFRTSCPPPEEEALAHDVIVPVHCQCNILISLAELCWKFRSATILVDDIVLISHILYCHFHYGFLRGDGSGVLGGGCNPEQLTLI